MRTEFAATWRHVPVVIALAVLVTATGISLTPSKSAGAQASCTEGSSFATRHDDRAFVPTIGALANKDDCLLGLGNQSPAVTFLQITLTECYGRGLAWDGIFGPKTEAAVVYAQQAEHIYADGVYGPQTRDHLKWLTIDYKCLRLA